MARKLKGFPVVETGAAAQDVSSGPVAVLDAPVKDDGKAASRWLPFEGSDRLPRPKTVEKTRVRNLPDGTEYTTKEVKYVKSGDPRYSVTLRGELIAHYLKRGGVGRRLVYQFKAKFPDTKEGKARRTRQEEFRDKLRLAGIPGA